MFVTEEARSPPPDSRCSIIAPIRLIPHSDNLYCARFMASRLSTCAPIPAHARKPALQQQYPLSISKVSNDQPVVWHVLHFVSQSAASSMVGGRHAISLTPKSSMPRRPFNNVWFRQSRADNPEEGVVNLHRREKCEQSRANLIWHPAHELRDVFNVFHVPRLARRIPTRAELLGVVLFSRMALSDSFSSFLTSSTNTCRLGGCIPWATPPNQTMTFG